MKSTFLNKNAFKRSLLATAVASISMASLAGEAVFYITEEGEAVNNISVKVDGNKKLVGKTGFVTFDLGSGKHAVELSQFGEWSGEFYFEASKKQNAEIQVEMIGGEAVPEISVYTPGQDSGVALGKISGFLESEETGGGVEGARISVNGSDLAVITNGEGYYELEIPRGEYTLTVAHPNYGNREVKNLRVISNVATNVNLNMSMSGDSMIEEVVAVGSYIPSSATAQQRDSSAVLSAIGSEQMSRFGDSNAASALKRVAGVTVSDGKYVVSRGLNERHSTIMLNGASLPSPDPSRRVVPLDIFPSTILDGIEVQKSFTPDVYADSTGAAIKLKTKSFPEEFEGKVSASLGFVSGLTLENRDVQQTEGLDILGIGSNGDRALPDAFNSYDKNLGASTQLAGQFASNLGTEETSILPNASIEVSAGNTIYDSGRFQVGFSSSFKYSNSWEKQDRESNTYDVNDDVLVKDDEFEQSRVSNDINLGAGISVGLITGNHELSSNTMLLRQTHTENVVESGVGGDQNRESVGYFLGWYERQFFFQQFAGEHLLSDAMETEINWQASISQATLNSPDEREYSFERDSDDNSDEFELYWSSLSRTYNELTDDNTSFSLDLASLVYAQDSFQAKLKYGASMFSRTREADATTVKYSGNGTTAKGFDGSLDIDAIVSSSISNGTVGITDGSRISDDYDATWDLTSYYLMADIEVFDSFKVLLGARAEDSSMKLNTYALASESEIIAKGVEVNDDDVFSSISFLYYVTEDIQARISAYDTINRPDFREIANTFYVDPETYDTYVGNTDLESSEVSNIDLRLEYYPTDSESISLAYFTKDFDQPIEKTLKTGGEVRSFENAERGELSGFEVDFRKEMDWERFGGFVSGNFAKIESDVDLIVGSTLKNQSMQGQPDQLANLQLGLDDLEAGAEYTILFNYQGESLEAVSIGDEPNVFKEPRMQLDFNYSKELTDSLTLKAKLKNITDEAYELTQGGKTYRKYKKGTEMNIGMSMPF